MPSDAFTTFANAAALGFFAFFGVHLAGWLLRVVPYFWGLLFKQEFFK